MPITPASYLRWEIQDSLLGQWRWTCHALNNDIVGASTEGYNNQTNCIENARLFGYSPDDGRRGLLSLVSTTVSPLQWRFYEDQAGHWRWACRAGNNRIVGASTEGYVKQSDCIENAGLFGYEEPVNRLASLLNA